MANRFLDYANQLDPISLGEMESVALLDRVDTKYLMSERDLLRALVHIGEHYHILSISRPQSQQSEPEPATESASSPAIKAGAMRLHYYETLYFDTPRFALYRQHYMGRPVRYKVRCRRYVQTDLCFLEIKQRSSQRGRTQKIRRRLAEMPSVLTPAMLGFVAKHCVIRPPDSTANLVPTLWNRFTRLTLVNRHSVERLTLDIDLHVEQNGVRIKLQRAAVAELKQTSASAASPFAQQMRALAIRPASFSKYCAGVARLYPQIKHNRFNPRLRQLERIGGGR